MCKPGNRRTLHTNLYSLVTAIPTETLVYEAQLHRWPSHRLVRHSEDTRAKECVEDVVKRVSALLLGIVSEFRQRGR